MSRTKEFDWEYYLLEDFYMNQRNEHNGIEPVLEVTDLEAQDMESIKGGPKKIFIGGLSATADPLPDLEPQAAVIGGAQGVLNNAPDPQQQTREHILLARQVGL
jgi:hypothetical protein